MNTDKTILAVDDDANILEVVRHYLEDEGYEVETAGKGHVALDLIADRTFSVILLDLGLPDMDGLTVIKQIRSETDTPIIVVSGKDEATDKIVGLELGADDYVTKPFNLRELETRIRTIMRRVETEQASDNNVDNKREPESAESGTVIRFDGWEMDNAKFELRSPDREPVGLTTSEFQLLRTLVESHNRVMSRERLFEITRGEDYESFDRAIDIQVGRLRKKLGDDPHNPKYIKTVRGIGYIFIGDVESPV